MKKKLIVLLGALMLLTFTGCGSKEKKIVVNVYEPGSQDPDVLTISDKMETVKELFDKIGSSNSIVSVEFKEDGTIAAVGGVESSDNGKWELYKNGNLLENTPDKETLSDGDVIDLKYSGTLPQEPQPQIVGGWQPFDKYNVVLNEKESEVFNKATGDMVSVEYTPIRVLATQVVNGTNYAYLASAKKILEVPVEEFCIVMIYEDSEGNVDLKAVNKLDPLKIETTDEVTDDLLGGWKVFETDNSGVLLDENAQASFNSAMEGYTGMNLQPIQLLASQLVSGMNYIALCRGETVTENPISGLCVVTWYAPLEGNAQISDVKPLNLEYYVAGA